MNQQKIFSELISVVGAKSGMFEIFKDFLDFLRDS